MSKPLSHELETVIDAINGTGHWASKDTKKISSSFGNITTIAKRLGVNRSTVYGYIKRWAGVREAIDDARETRKDLVEDKMMKRIMEGSDTMVIFFAKTQMKDRGYVERQEIENSGNVEVVITRAKDHNIT